MCRAVHKSRRKSLSRKRSRHVTELLGGGVCESQITLQSSGVDFPVFTAHARKRICYFLILYKVSLGYISHNKGPTYVEILRHRHNAEINRFSSVLNVHTPWPLKA